MAFKGNIVTFQVVLALSLIYFLKIIIITIFVLLVNVIPPYSSQGSHRYGRDKAFYSEFRAGSDPLLLSNELNPTE